MWDPGWPYELPGLRYRRRKGKVRRKMSPVITEAGLESWARAGFILIDARATQQVKAKGFLDFVVLLPPLRERIKSSLGHVLFS